MKIKKITLLFVYLISSSLTLLSQIKLNPQSGNSNSKINLNVQNNQNNNQNNNQLNTKMEDFAFQKGKSYLSVGMGSGSPYFSDTKEGTSSYYSYTTVTSVSKSIPIVATYDYAYNNKISFGGNIGYASEEIKQVVSSNTLTISGSSLVGEASTSKTINFNFLVFGVHVSYHIVQHENWDPYVTIGLGYNKTNYTVNSGVVFNAQIGTRYMFTDKFGAFANVGYGVAYLSGGLALKF